MVCFVFDGIAASDLATLLSEQKIALRVGEHLRPTLLSSPWWAYYIKTFFAPYNSPQDVDAFFAALDKSLELLAC